MGVSRHSGGVDLLFPTWEMPLSKNWSNQVWFMWDERWSASRYKYWCLTFSMHDQWLTTICPIDKVRFVDNTTIPEIMIKEHIIISKGAEHITERLNTECFQLNWNSYSSKNTQKILAVVVNSPLVVHVAPCICMV